ncbi:MAG: 5-(carboxyamino)imidazole ribonucleotide synthase [Cyclobacteriaceae bacterium]|nr:5-(carboxyamino)imidazole ribonucleotide synthase [Cyclobacteriaceae bacterium]
MLSNFNQNIKLGVLGGGQLGRMLVQSAIDFNLDVHILDPDPDAPCNGVVKKFQVGSLTDFDTVYQFGKDCDVITIEIENVNIEALKKLKSEGKKVFPQPEVIELIQDKRTQKQFYKTNNIPTAEFILTSSKQEVLDNKQFLPAVNKLGKEGYDGRGVQMLRSSSDLEKAFDKPGILEKLIDFEKEIAVIVARTISGEVVTYPVVELVFHPEHNLVEYLFSPANVTPEISKKAEKIAIDVIEKLDMIGILAVEMFVDKKGEVLVNEVAPRPHNSGHQTIEGNITSQYEQHLRAVLGWPLGKTQQLIPAAMVNILGHDGNKGIAKYEGMDDILSKEGVHVHLYGKKITKPFRKMGHVTIVDKDANKLKNKVNFVKQTLKVKA